MKLEQLVLLLGKHEMSVKSLVKIILACVRCYFVCI